MRATDIADSSYFHKVVDCQWACPAHTPVPEYIRLIAHGRYTDAYMVNWKSNVFPGILGRTCDRPCEPACRRGRSQASLTVARDLAMTGYEVTVIDQDPKLGGMIRTQIPRFRLPEQVIDDEVGYITGIGNVAFQQRRVDSLKGLLAEGWDAVFVGSGAPRGRDLDIPGRQEAAANIHIGIDWLSNVSFGHIEKIGKRVIVLGGGNTAMDCCRTARRLGGDDVKVIVRSGFEEMKASPWEKEDAIAEDIPILNFLVPKSFVHEGGRLVGMTFEKVQAEYDANGRRRLVPTGEEDPYFECDDVLVAVGQENAFPWIERDIGLDFDDRWDMPKVDETTMRSTHPKVFFGGDAAFGPKNIIWAVAHGHEAAVSIHTFLDGGDPAVRPAPAVDIVSQKMGIHEWSYDNDVALDARFKVPHRPKEESLRDIRAEVELGFDQQLAWKEAQRCLNCDIQTVFTAQLCIECDACVDICPMDCITFTENGEEDEIRGRLNAPATNADQAVYIGDGLKTGRIMAKDEDVCLHCGLCAERCPTGAWDMRKYLIEMSHAERACGKH